MDKDIIAKYLKYANSVESYAVLFVKKYFSDYEGKWVDILDYEDHRYYYENYLEFKSVECALYDRKLKPVYPPKKNYKSDLDYELACRAITWETANKDIDSQKNKNVKVPVYLIEGVKYNSTRGKDYFVDNAPPEIKKLAKNINDRTDPLWDKALQYARKPNYVFKIKQIKQLS